MENKIVAIECYGMRYLVMVKNVDNNGIYGTYAYATSDGKIEYLEGGLFLWRGIDYLVITTA